MWDRKYPDWREGTVGVISFIEPKMSMTRQEVADSFDMPLEAVTDKLFYSVSWPHHYLVLPEAAIEKFQEVENKNG